MRLPRNICLRGWAYVYILLWLWLCMIKRNDGFRPAEFFYEVLSPHVKMTLLVVDYRFIFITITYRTLGLRGPVFIINCKRTQLIPFRATFSISHALAIYHCSRSFLRLLGNRYFKNSHSLPYLWPQPIFFSVCITPDGSTAEELSSCIQKARLAFSNLHHLWRQNDIKLSTKRTIYSAAVRSVLLYGSETWPLKAEDIRRLSVLDHRCLRSIGKIWWEHKISNTEVRWRVLGPKNMSIIEQVHHHRPRWLGHVLRMSGNRLLRRALFAEPKSSWKRPSGDQHMTWQRNMKSLTKGLSRVGNVRLADWGPRDPSHLWLETLSDMASSRSQWHSYTFSLALSS